MWLPRMLLVIAILAVLPAQHAVAESYMIGGKLLTYRLGLEYQSTAPNPKPNPGAARCIDRSYRLLYYSAAKDISAQKAHLDLTSVPPSVDAVSFQAAAGAAAHAWSWVNNDCGYQFYSPVSISIVPEWGGLSAVPADDGKNTVSFAAGVCTALQVACTVIWPQEGKGKFGWDIVLNTAYPWGFGLPNAMDVQNALTHEFGHVAGLADLPSSPTLTMYGATWPGDTTKRKLGLGDVLGLQAIAQEVKG